MLYVSSSMLDALHRCWFSYFLGISVWLKYFISIQKFCYCRLIHVNFGILFFCAFTSVISQALFTLISIALSIIFFPFSYKLICCNSFLPGLPTHTLSALHSKLILMNDSFHLTVTAQKSSVVVITYRISPCLLLW